MAGTHHIYRSSTDIVPVKIIHKSSAFTGGTPSTHGAVGDNPTYTIFTVTGVIEVHSFFGIVNTALTGTSADLEVGVTGNLATLCGLHIDVAATLNQHGVFAQSNADLFGSPLLNSFRDNAIIINGSGTDIIETVLSANITAGQIDYYMTYIPMSEGAVVTEAGTLS